MDVIMNSFIVLATLCYVAFILAFIISGSVHTGEYFDQIIKDNEKYFKERRQNK